MLPTTRKDPGPFHPSPNNAMLCLRFIARRYLVFGITAFVLFSLLLRTLYLRRENTVQTSPFPESDHQVARWPGLKLPPLYAQYHQYEHHLPQHHWPASSHATEPNMFWIPGHSKGSGWGNIMQEILLNAFLAHQANRAFVFYNYTWNDNHAEDYADYNGKPIPSRVPLTALLRGPIVGGPWPAGDHAPVAVSEEYWHHICDDRAHVVPRADVHDHLSSGHVGAITTGWVEKLHALDHEQCVEAGGDGGPPYTWMTMGDKEAMHDVWPELRKSPVLTHFAHSALVELAFDTNREVFAPTTILEPPLSAAPLALPAAARYTQIPGLLVLHVRRGDYEGHCEHLARWSSTYLAYNTLPELPDRFDPPPGGSWGDNTPENFLIYKAHCFPSVAQIVHRVAEVVADDSDAARGLQHVYVMTNADAAWIAELKAALEGMGRWASVSASRDLVLNWEQKYVAQAVDMLIAQRAQVFVGNGWSSLTGNAVILRMANGFPPNSTRFW
ncbi:hypothetical protein BC628DRAFT_1349629 [Trametes gibbosa]|nr:hypothetical protein BC628DRAFT_1349629 [Trametes gibbosa]